MPGAGSPESIGVWVARVILCGAVLGAAAIGVAPAQAAFPGINEGILYTSTYGEEGQGLYRAALDGSGAIRIVAGPVSSPTVSADGTKIAYATQGSIVVADHDGADPETVVPSSSGGSVPSFSPDGEKLAYSAYEGAYKIYTIGVDGTGKKLISGSGLVDPVFSPDGQKIVASGTISNVSTVRGLSIMDADGGNLQPLETEGEDASFSPDGEKIIYSRIPPGLTYHEGEIWEMNADGTGQKPLTDSPNLEEEIRDYRPRYSPDGTKILFLSYDRDGNFGEFDSPALNRNAWVMNADGTGLQELSEIPQVTATEWLPAPAGDIKVDLSASGLDDDDETFTVELLLKNNGSKTVEDLKFTDPNVLGVSAAGFPEGGRAEVVQVDGPEPAVPGSLAPGETRTHTFVFRIISGGRVAIFTEATGKSEGKKRDDAHTLVVDATIPSDGYTGESLAMAGLEQYIVAGYSAWIADSKQEAKRIYNKLKKKLPPWRRKVQFGSKNKLKVSPEEKSLAARAGIADEMAAAVLPDRSKAPKKKRKKVPNEYDVQVAFMNSYYKGLAKRGKESVSHLGKKVKQGVGISVAAAKNMIGQATPEERAQLEAIGLANWKRSADKAQINWDDADGKKVLARYGHSMYKEYGGGAAMISSEDVNRMWNDVTLQSEDLQLQLKQDKIKKANIARKYQKDPIAGAKAHGDAVAEESYPWLQTMFETMLGAGVERVGGAVIKKGTGMVRAAKGTGEITSAGKVAKGPSKIRLSAVDGTGAGPTTHELVTGHKGKGAIVGESLTIESSVGGIPVREADIQRQIIAEIETELAVQGTPVDIGLALKPSSPLRKPNSVAKFELAKVKTGKFEHEALGMHPDALSEPTFFKPIKPEKVPGFKKMSKAEQAKIEKTYKSAKREYNDWTSGKPKDPDLAKLSKATQRVGGPKLKKPVEIPLAHGRTAKAIFEEVPVKGTDTIRIRAKYYEVDGIVFLDAKKARPMGPDLDGVALFDAKAGARIADRQIENKVVRLYRKKIAERVRAGERFHGAEHGLTLIMDDVGAGPKGAVGFLMQYGLPYLPEEVARDFVKRIAPFTEMTEAQILGQIDQFGKPLINVTSTEVYYGRLPVNQW